MDTDAIENLVHLGVDGFLMVSDLADMDEVLEATGNRPLVGIGSSRRKAEQAAAQQALERLS